MIIFGYIFIAIAWAILLVMLYNDIRKPVYFIWRHTIRSGDYSLSGLWKVLQMAWEIY